MRRSVVLSALVLALVATQTHAAGSRDWAGCGAVDGSGSNGSPSGSLPPSDPGPTFQRVEGLKLLAGLLPAEATGAQPELALVFFGSRTIDVPFLPVADPTARAELVRRAEELAPLNLGWTRLTDGVERCLTLLEAVDRGRPRFLLVLSDFVPEDQDPEHGFDAQRQRLVETLVPRLQRAGIVVYAVGYGQAAGQDPSPFRELMAQLAGPTGGLALAVQPSEPSLFEAVGRISAHLARAQYGAGRTQTAPDATRPLAVSVEVPPGATGLVLVGEHPDDPTAGVSIIEPDGRQRSPAAGQAGWLVAETFHQLHVPSPRPGRWQVEVRARGRVRVHHWWKPAPTPQPSPAAASARPAAASPPPASPAATTVPAPPPTWTPAPAAVALDPEPAASASADPVPTPEPTASAESRTEETSALLGWLLMAPLLALLAAAALAPLGYRRWSGTSETAPAWPSSLAGKLSVENGADDSAPLALDDKKSLVVGSGEECGLVLAGAGIAERHLKLVPDLGGLGRPTARAVPLEGPVICNDEPLPAAGRPLADGDVLALGDQKLVYLNLGA